MSSRRVGSEAISPSERLVEAIAAVRADASRPFADTSPTRATVGHAGPTTIGIPHAPPPNGSPIHPHASPPPQVRADAVPTDWALGVLGEDGVRLGLVGSGTGGAAALASQLTSDAVYYGIIRTTTRVTTDEKDSSRTVKFVLVSFIGGDLAPMKRAKVSTIKGAVTEVFTPFHAEILNATDPAEVTAKAVDDLLHEMFGQVTDAPAAGEASIRIGMREIKMSGKAPARKTEGLSASQGIAASPELLDALANVRADASPTNWALGVLDEGGATLSLVGAGLGGVAAFAAHITDTAVYYGLIRTTDVIDRSSTVKFVFVIFIGSALSPMKRAKVSTIKGSVSEVFAPYHAELMNLTERAEVTQSAVDEVVAAGSHGGAIGSAVGAGARRAEGTRAEGGTSATAIGGRFTSSTHAPRTGVAAPPQPVAQAAAPVVLAAIAAVRADKDPTTWAAFGYEDDKGAALRVLGTGSGSPLELVKLLDPLSVAYALMRSEAEVDGGSGGGTRPTVVRFTLLSWVGEQTPPMRKAKLSTARGAALALLSPYHDEKLNLCAHEDVVSALSAGSSAAA